MTVKVTLILSNAFCFLSVFPAQRPSYFQGLGTPIRCAACDCRVMRFLYIS